MALIFSGCNRTTEEVSPSEESEQEVIVEATVVATYSGDQTITRSEVDELILEAPATDRHPGEADFAVWYGAWIEQLFLNRVLLEEALKQELEQQPRLRTDLRVLRRSHYTDTKIQAEMAKLPPISEEEIGELIENKRAELEIPESRQIFHIFRRFDDTPENSKEAILEELEAVRRRVDSGENFGLIAQKISDSESRHKNGNLGLISRGQISDSAEAVIFSLPEGEVSEPLVAKDGAHLFFNENTRAPYQPTSDELRVPIINDLTYLKATEVLENLANSASIKTTQYIPDDSELLDLLKESKPEKVIFALGTFELTLREFRGILRNTAKQLGGRRLPVDNMALAIFNEVKNREILFQSMLADTETDYSDIETRYEKAKARLLVRTQIRRRMVTWLDRNRAVLIDYFTHNRKRFDSPDEVRLRGLRIPIDASAPSKMATLEKAVTEIAAGETSFDTVASTLGATISEWGWFDPNQLAALDKRAARSAFGMQAGELSPPYTTNGQIVMFEVLDREKGIPASFEKNRSSIVNQYLTEKFQEVRSEVVDAIKMEKSFQEYPAHFPRPATVLGNSENGQ